MKKIGKILFRVLVFPLLIISAGFFVAGCGNMKKQRNLRAFDPSAHFPNGASDQLPPPHTVAQGMANNLSAQPAETVEKIEGIPIPVTAQLLQRGQERFDIYCAVCHGADGYGRGIVVARGFPPPPSFHDQRVRLASVGHYFNVMTRGYGVMYAYGDRLEENDRWAVAAYIRALQRSQHATVPDVPSEHRADLAP